MSAAILGALKYLPATIARKALTKVNPGFDNFFSKALTYGIDANRALDFLTEKFESDAQRDHARNLERGAANNTLRPDEKVSRSEMANAAIPGKILKGAASLAIGGGLGGLGSEAPQQSAPAQSAAMTPTAKQQALEKFNQRSRKKAKSPLSAESLEEQFGQRADQQGQGKAALLDTMKELTAYLQQLKAKNG